MWRNRGGVSGHEIYDGGANITVSYSNIGQDGYTGNNIINTDPLFVDPADYSFASTADGDYHLQPDSPCIDAGISTGAPSDDTDGDTRPQE